MVLNVEDVVEMLSVLAEAYERSPREGLATHNALLRMINNRLLTKKWIPMSLPSGMVYNEQTKGATA